MLWYENISYRNYKVYNDIPVLLNEHPELNHTEAIIFLLNHDNGFGSNLTTIIQFSYYLHLCTFKTPPSGAVMSERGDADCAFLMRNGVKN